MEKSDAYRAATFLIKGRGSKAAAHARENVEWMLSHDDLEAAADWQQILQAIADIQTDDDIAVAEPGAETRGPVEAV